MQTVVTFDTSDNLMTYLKYVNVHIVPSLAINENKWLLMISIKSKTVLFIFCKYIKCCFKVL